MPLAEMLSEYWRTLQGDLFPWLEEDLGPLGAHHRRFVTVIETIRLEAFVAQWSGLSGRPQKDRAALARAFVGALSRGVILLSALIGAILLLTSDLAARVLLSPQELPIGIVTSSAGAIFVAVMLIRHRG